MAFFKTSGGQVHYECYGNADAPVLVLSHSLGVSGEMWQGQVPYFAKNLRVVTCDTRGHGQTTATPGPYTIAMLGRDALALLDELRVEKAHFCGLSMGGAIGIWLGVNAPERLSRLVLSNTAAKLGTAESWKTRIDSVERGGMKSVAPGIIERWFTAGFRGSRKEVVAKTQNTIAETNASGYIACCEALRDMDARENVEKISAPTLVIVGADDPVTTRADGQFLVGKIRDAKYVELHAAHLSNIEDAPGFNIAAGSFLGA